MVETADVIIVGGGVMGCATAYQLAKSGLRVIVLEQFTIGNHMGSSHGASRLFRLAHTDPYYVELARAAYTLWHELESESGQQLMQLVDALDLGSSKALKKLISSLQASNVAFELLDRNEIVHRFPHFALPEDTLGLYQADYGMLRADLCVSTFAEQARLYGVTIAEEQTVQHVHPWGDSVQIQTDKVTYSARWLILCAGSWMRPLLRQLDLDLPLVVRKEHITFYKPGDPEEWLPGRFPLFRHHLTGSTGRWGVGFPIFAHAGAKMLLDCTGPIIEPEDLDRSVDQAVLGMVRAYIASILPTLGEDIIGAETCRYTMTPDEDFILDRHPAHPQIIIASPCSGHGFKFAPLIGCILADLALRGATEYSIERFRLDRPALMKGNG
ncbi:MAG TPA: N-methyl-L-tryptophan oxidase [Anaerolineales bacterium]|nr:N-methyl-L-tryptophan oxidase [Anaerolineales bacterium]